MRAARALVYEAVCGAILLLTVSPMPARGQDRFEVGLGVGVADTEQNAIAGTGTVTWNVVGWLGGVALRAFLDSEWGVPDFKEGLRYDEDSGREYIIDESGRRQNPRGDELWESRGWDAHLGLYATIRPFPRIHAGGGLAYNGLDSKAGLAVLLYIYATERTEFGVEWLTFEGSNWRLRLTFGFWRFE